MSSMVPTRLRTMWWRNPLPRTRYTRRLPASCVRSSQWEEKIVRTADRALRLNRSFIVSIRSSCGQIGVGCGEAEKVVFACKLSGSGLECVEVDAPGIGIDVAGQKRRADLAGTWLGEENPIFIGLCDR